MVRSLTLDHTYDATWNVTVEAYHRRFPDSMARFNIVEMTVSDYAEDEDCIRYTRKAKIQNPAPYYIRKMMGLETFEFIQYAVIDKKAKRMSLLSENNTIADKASMLERCTFSIHPDDPKKTSFTQTATLQLRPFMGLEKKGEEIILNNYEKSFTKGRETDQELIDVVLKEKGENGDGEDDGSATLLAAIHRSCDNLAENKEIPIDRKLSVADESCFYTITLKTGPMMGAGTDANIFINLYGENGQSGKAIEAPNGREMREKHWLQHLNTHHFNLGPRGTDIVRFKSTDLGTLHKIQIAHDDVGLGSGWFLEEVVIQNEISGEEWQFPCHRWLAKDEDDHSCIRELLLPETTYKCTFYTGDIFGAGTDADVYISLIGDKGETIKQRLPAESGVNLERGKVDVFELSTSDVGELEKISLGHNNSGLGAGWFLEAVEIVQDSTQKKWFFPCFQWFSKDEGDEKIAREILVSHEEIDLEKMREQIAAEKKAGGCF